MIVNFDPNGMDVADFKIYKKLKKLDNVNEIPDWVCGISKPSKDMKFIYMLGNGYYYCVDRNNRMIKHITNPTNIVSGYYIFNSVESTNQMDLELDKEVKSPEDLIGVSLLIPKECKEELGNLKTIEELIEIVRKKKCVELNITINYSGEIRNEICDGILEYFKNNGYTFEYGNQVMRKDDERFAIYNRHGRTILICVNPEDKYYNYVDSGRVVMISPDDNIIFCIDREMDKLDFNIDGISKRIILDIQSKLPEQNSLERNGYYTYYGNEIYDNIKRSFECHISTPNCTKKLEKFSIITDDKFACKGLKQIQHIYLFEASMIKDIAWDKIEETINKILDESKINKYVGKLQEIARSNKRIELHGGVVLDKNKYLFPEAHLEILENGSPLLYSRVVNITKGMLESFRITDLMEDIYSLMYKEKEINISVKLNPSGTKYSIHIKDEGKIYINKFRINRNEVLQVLERIPCVQSQEEFDAFLKSVSKLSLKMHDIIVNGMMSKNLEMIFYFKKEKGKWFIKSGVDSWIKLENGYSRFKSIRLDLGNITMPLLFEDDNQKNIQEKRIIAVVNEIKKEFPDMSLEDCIGIATQAQKEYEVVNERANKLLEDAITSLDEHIVLKNDNMIVIKGISGKHYKVCKKDLKVYNCDEKGNQKDYICIADSSSDAVHLDRFVTRLYCLANDADMTKEISTLRI